jgi:ecdysteroid 25-hydroxylase
LLVSILLILLIAHILKRKRELKDTPPGPWGNYIPYVGFLPFLDAKRPEQSLSSLSVKYGKIFSLQMGSIYTVVLSDVALIREAFKRDELSGRAPLLVTHGIFYGYGEAVP